MRTFLLGGKSSKTMLELKTFVPLIAHLCKRGHWWQGTHLDNPGHIHLQLSVGILVSGTHQSFSFRGRQNKMDTVGEGEDDINQTGILYAPVLRLFFYGLCPAVHDTYNNACHYLLLILWGAMYPQILTPEHYYPRQENIGRMLNRQVNSIRV